MTQLLVVWTTLWPDEPMERDALVVERVGRPYSDAVELSSTIGRKRTLTFNFESPFLAEERARIIGACGGFSCVIEWNARTRVEGCSI